MYNFNMTRRVLKSMTFSLVKRKIWRFTICILLLLGLVTSFNSCSSNKEFRRSFIVWGTNLDFIVISDLESVKVQEIIMETQKIALEKSIVFNNYDKESEISRFNFSNANTITKMSDDFSKLFEISIKYNQITDGYFDISLGSLTSKLNYKSDTSSRISKKEINRIISKCIGLKNLNYDPQQQTISKKVDCIQIDFGGIAEGYVLSLMIDKLVKSGIEDALINFGGNITTISKKHDWTIDLKKPYKDSEDAYIRSDLNNLSISTSGTYSKTFLVKNKKKSHIFDPINKEFKDSKNLSISVISDNPIHSDAISTSLISMPIETAIEKIKNFKNSTFLIIEALDNSNIKEIHNNLNTK